MGVALSAVVLPAGAASAQTPLGAALVPPPGLQPFAELTPEFPQRDAGGYTLKYALRPGAAGRYGGAAVSGSLGRTKYDDDVFFDATLRHRDCAPDAPYCASAHMEGAPPSTELFRGLQVNGAPAFATHIVCCNGQYWWLTWYDSNAGMTYRLELEGDVAIRYGEGTSEANRIGAQSLADITAQLVALR